jgi:hypothetical protein
MRCSFMGQPHPRKDGIARTSRIAEKMKAPDLNQTVAPSRLLSLLESDGDEDMGYSGSIFLTGLIAAFGLFAVVLFAVSLFAPASEAPNNPDLD